MAKDALGAHARDEIGLAEGARADPVQAAIASAVASTVGAALPILTALFSTKGRIAFAVPLAALLFVAALGALAMAVTAGIGAMVGGFV
jgi:VIT1/CCC1 family predicted Fe2+/Mn2+ transporter